MAKSLFLLLCCVFVPWGLQAQAPRPDTAIPQKLQLKRAGPGRADQPYLFGKKTADMETDNVRSLMYTGPTRRDSVQLGLPALKSKKIDFQIKTGQREPLFRRQ